MAYITKANSKRILRKINLNDIPDIAGEVYKKPIYFLSKWEGYKKGRVTGQAMGLTKEYNNEPPARFCITRADVFRMKICGKFELWCFS